MASLWSFAGLRTWRREDKDALHHCFLQLADVPNEQLEAEEKSTEGGRHSFEETSLPLQKRNRLAGVRPDASAFFGQGKKVPKV